MVIFCFVFGYKSMTNFEFLLVSLISLLNGKYI